MKKVLLILFLLISTNCFGLKRAREDSISSDGTKRDRIISIQQSCEKSLKVLGSWCKTKNRRDSFTRIATCMKARESYLFLREALTCPNVDLHIKDRYYELIGRYRFYLNLELKSLKKDDLALF